MIINKKARKLLTPEDFTELVHKTIDLLIQRFGEKENIFVPMLKQILIEIPEWTEIGVGTVKVFDDGSNKDLMVKLIMIDLYINKGKCDREFAEEAMGRKLA